MLYILAEGTTPDIRLKNHKTTGVGQAFATAVVGTGDLKITERDRLS
jgi:hypothetical protein